MTVCIIDYGLGNLSSVRKAIEDQYSSVKVICKQSDCIDPSHIILPGVGSFKDGMERLHNQGWTDYIYEHALQRKRPVLGICLGMQMLSTFGNEGGLTNGLNLIPGVVDRIDEKSSSFRVPHMGWNDISISDSYRGSLFEGISKETDFYFVHSFILKTDREEHTIAKCDYGSLFSAVVSNENIYGCQFHPEKSSKSGRIFIKNFLSFS